MKVNLISQILDLIGRNMYWNETGKKGSHFMTTVLPFQTQVR